ncbi:MAG TPA: 30S ribosomal protein S20 [Coxiellaceae bacterium]|nr:30S ribosomal protein S20 [Coxiellaceae bacterium]
MANTAQARKRARQANVRREQNFSQKSAIRTAIKKLLKAIAAGDKAAAQTTYKVVTVLADKAANKNLIPANRAARIKSRLNQRLKALA